MASTRVPNHPRQPARAASLPVVGVTSPAPRALWRQAVETDAMSLADHGPEWADALVGQRRWTDASRLYHLEDGSSVVLPLFRHSHGPAWFESPPYGWGFGGLAGPRAHEPQVVAAVLADLAALRAVRVRVRPNPLVGPVWTAASASAAPSARLLDSRAHVLDVRPGPEALLAAMKKETRRHIRRAESEGIEVEVGAGPRLLEAYQHLRALSVARWAEQTHEPGWLARRRAIWSDPPGRTEALAERLGDRYRVRVARLGGQPVAASIVVLGRNAHATRSAMDRERVGSLGVMPYLDWLSIQEAHAVGCDWFHLGETGASSALASYKQGLGAVAYTYDEIRMESLPITATDAAARRAVKRVLGFVDDSRRRS